MRICVSHFSDGFATALRHLKPQCKSLFLAALLALTACSVNPATGERQFAAFMPPAQEARVGAEEHNKIMRLYGAPAGTENLQNYIENVGQAVARDTERPEVMYKFFLLDDPMVNAFALPGGYVYITRGLLAQAGSEAELAAVLGHEVGHITARHSAERYSQGVVTSVGAAVLAAAIDNTAAAQALGLGGDLYLKSYSRGQEHQADELGIRYLHRAGYDPQGMGAFLRSLDAHTKLEGGGGPPVAWFSTHPLTADRVQNTAALAGQYPAQGEQGRERYLSMIDGLVYGESARQGFVRGTDFYHTEMDFTFSVPKGFKMSNQPQQVAASDGSGAAIIFDAAPNPQWLDAYTYLTQVWMQGEILNEAEPFELSGRRAARASFSGKVAGKPAVIMLAAIEWKPGTIFRFQMAVPQGAPETLAGDMKRTVQSLRPLTADEKRNIRPHRLRIVTAKAGDTVATLSASMPFESNKQPRFRALNAMGAGEEVIAGRKYKVVGER